MITECGRVEEAERLLSRGNLTGLGAVMTEGHRSLAADYRVSVPAVDDRSGSARPAGCPRGPHDRWRLRRLRRRAVPAGLAGLGPRGARAAKCLAGQSVCWRSAARDVTTSASSTPTARPLSTDSQASSTPPARSAARPATRSAAAAFNTPMSRRALRSPSSTERRRRALKAASPPRRSSMVAFAKPSANRIDPPVADLELPRAVAGDLEHTRRRRHAQFVEAVVRVHDHGVPAARRSEDARHDRPHRRVAHANQLVPGARGVGERSEVVEDGGHTKLLAHRPDEAHGGVEALGEAEAHAGLRHATGDALGADLDGHAQRLEHVGCPHRRGGGPVAVLADGHAAARGDEGGECGHVDAGEPVAPGAHQVDDDGVTVRTRPGGAGVQWARHGGLDHGPRQPRHLLGRLPLGVQQGEEGPHLRRRGITGQDDPQRLFGLLRGERLVARQPGEDVGPTQSHQRSRSKMPRAIRPSCTCEVPSTMVNASRRGTTARSGGPPCSRRRPEAGRRATRPARPARSRGTWPWTGRGRTPW